MSPARVALPAPQRVASRNRIAATCALGLIVLIALACESNPAEAAVYRCDKEGKVTYSDRPCGDNAKTILPGPKAAKAAEPPPAPVPAPAHAAAPEKSAAGTPPAPAVAPVSAPVDAHQQQEALSQCVAETYNAWYFKQQPKPSKSAMDVKLKSVGDECRKLHPTGRTTP